MKSNTETCKQAIDKADQIRSFLPKARDVGPATPQQLAQIIRLLAIQCSRRLRAVDVGDLGVADDIVQTFMLRVLTNDFAKRVICSRGTLRQFLHGVLRWTSREVTRRRLLRLPNYRQLPRERVSLSPAENVEFREDLETTRHCFSLLTKREQAAINARCGGGLFGMLTHSAPLDCRVQCLATRAIQRLRSMIDKYRSQRHRDTSRLAGGGCRSIPVEGAQSRARKVKRGNA